MQDETIIISYTEITETVRVSELTKREKAIYYAAYDKGRFEKMQIRVAMLLLAIGVLTGLTILYFKS